MRTYTHRQPPEREGGVWIPSDQCSDLEITRARACGRWWQYDEGEGLGIGWVWRPTLNSVNRGDNNG